jgi:Putative addiction module component
MFGVSQVADSLLEQALTLPAQDRAMLASGLLASLEADQLDGGEVDRLWSAETARRAEGFELGADVVTWEQVLQRVDERR